MKSYFALFSFFLSFVVSNISFADGETVGTLSPIPENAIACHSSKIQVDTMSVVSPRHGAIYNYNVLCTDNKGVGVYSEGVRITDKLFNTMFAVIAQMQEQGFVIRTSLTSTKYLSDTSIVFTRSDTNALMAKLDKVIELLSD
jgi:hypothetical protein